MALTKSLNDSKLIITLTIKEKVMVRKVRVLDEVEVETSEAKVPEGMEEVAQAIDWKLWEMLKILQNIEEMLKNK